MGEAKVLGKERDGGPHFSDLAVYSLENLRCQGYAGSAWKPLGEKTTVIDCLRVAHINSSRNLSGCSNSETPFSTCTLTLHSALTRLGSALIRFKTTVILTDLLW